ncbi:MULTISPECIES: GNAT family N-acetyltransferase [Bacillus]|uniref:GNAT family N-acetyltransferase n=1 Tax=Bacillus TaxID=1386 RepID=UPI0003056A47|nr:MULTISPECIES: GNAT family N-acetyltransferase [Bacillus]
MNMIEKIVALDCDYLSSFSNKMSCEAGVLFYNEKQPNYYDANHAHIWRKVKCADHLLQEIKQFYLEKQLIPRVYLYNVHENLQFVEALERHGFSYETFSDSIQLWNGQLVNLPNNPDIEIERVIDENLQEALDIECSIQEFGGRSVREKAFLQEFQSPHFTFYLLRYKGVACCTASLFQIQNQSRVESVATLLEYRGRGLIAHLLRFIQQKVIEQHLQALWVFPINEHVEKVYQKSNFETKGKWQVIHAFTSGKSISNIRKGVTEKG